VRALGIDLGEVRIGVALSDQSATLASPLTVIERGRSHEEDHRRIADLVSESGAGLVVVGLPLSLDGGERRAAEQARAEIAELTAALSVPIQTEDERLTTVLATRLRREATERQSRVPAGRGRRASSGGGGHAVRGHTKASRRPPIDAEAAAVILQSYLDRSAGTPPGGHRASDRQPG